MFLLNNDVISWNIKKQTYITLSIMEVEFVVLLATVQEGVWLKIFFYYLDVAKDATNLLLINYDSQAVITYTKNLKFHCKTKHLDIKYNLIKDMVV